MLNKRFKTAKCKTSLKLATSRIKLLKNKKVIQISQMKKELAQLLESGQDRTARIRVEHVIREEKMVEAYDLIEIYCELIVARLAIIESQKTCPIDLKEAITSVIFAAPRCSDIPELADARKNFTAKYGKEFISAAIEMRPDCGVSRMLVEKLSAVAPDVQTKMKVLGAVAKEQNVNWDPTTFEEKELKPPDDLLNGPTSFEKASMINVDPPKIQTSNFHNVHNHEESPNVHLDFSQQNKRFMLGAQNITAADTGGVQMPAASATHDDVRSSGMASEEMKTRQFFHSNANNSSSGRENWNMEFKDATSAAQAAAESAERASIAARVAAQLSSQGNITRQHSTGSHGSHIGEEKHPVSATSEFPGQHHFKYSYNSSFVDRRSEIQQMGPREHDISPKATKRFDLKSNGGTIKSSRSDSLKSRNDTIKESSVKHDISPKATERFDVDRHAGTTKSSRYDSLKSRNDSSHSHSTTFDDEQDVLTSDKQKVSKRIVDQENHLRESMKTSSYDDAHIDDETDSDSDGPRFDIGFEYDEGEAKAFFPSPGREPIRPLGNEHIWSPRRNTRSTTNQLSAPSILSAKSVDPSVNFDLSDGPNSESENEMAKPTVTETKKFTSSRKQDFFSTFPESAYAESSQKVISRKSRIELNDLVERGSFCNNDEDISLKSRQSSSVSRRHESKNNIDPNLVEDNIDSLKYSDDLGNSKEINFGTLTGGLRNKGGLMYPPYMKSSVIDASSSPKKFVEAEEIPIKADQTSKLSSFKSRANRLENKKESVSVSSSESDSDDYNEKFPVQSSKIRSRFAPPDSFLNNDGIDSEEEVPPVPKMMPASRIHMGSGLSQRTKSHVEPKADTVLSSTIKARRASMHSSTNESPAEPRSYSMNFKEDPEPISESPKTSSTAAERKSSRRSNSNKSLSEPRTHTARSEQEPFQTIPEPKMSEPPNPPKKFAESGKTEAPKTSNLSSETSFEANNVKKPSHVHPKLPDYDSLAARIQSLRANHH